MVLLSASGAAAPDPHPKRTAFWYQISRRSDVSGLVCLRDSRQSARRWFLPQILYPVKSLCEVRAGITAAFDEDNGCRIVRIRTGLPVVRKRKEGLQKKHSRTGGTLRSRAAPEGKLTEWEGVLDYFFFCRASCTCPTMAAEGSRVGSPSSFHLEGQTSFGFFARCRLALNLRISSSMFRPRL